MKQYRTILVAVSFDERDATTLRHAARFAVAAESETVYLAHIAASFDLPEEVSQKYPELVRPVDEEVSDRLQAIADEQRTAFPERTRLACVAREGHPSGTLIRLAAQKSADLVCVGAHDEIAHPIHVAASAIVRKAPCSVLIVPASYEPVYERILVPLDFSEPSRAALEQAIALASTDGGATLEILHVYDVPIGASKTGQPYQQVAAIMRDVAEGQWSEFSQSVDFRKVPWDMRYELSSNASGAIDAVADEIDARLIVLASHGRTRPAGFLLGHVADSVCSRVSRPVLCVKKKGEVVNLLRALRQLYDLE